MIHIFLMNEKNQIKTNIELDISKDDVSISGYTFDNNKKKLLCAKDVRNFIDLIKLKKIKKSFGLIEGYEIFSDENDLIHFFKDGKEDYLSHLLFNSKDSILYDIGENDELDYSIKKLDEKDLKKKLKIFLKKTRHKLLNTTLFINVSLLLFTYYVGRNTVFTDHDIRAMKYQISSDYINCSSIDEFVNRIKIQMNLTDEEKSILTNKEILNYIYQYTGDKMFEKIGLGLNIEEMSNGFMFSKVLGYHNSITPNSIFVRSNLDELNKHDTIIHEYMHFFQNNDAPRLLNELTASSIEEMFSKDSNKYCSAYYYHKNNFNLLKLLVGEDLIMQYCFGDVKEIEKLFEIELKKYLIDSEYKKLDMLLDPISSLLISNEEYIEEISNILLEACRNKYGEEVVNEIEAFCFNDSDLKRLNKYSMKFEEAEKKGLIFKISNDKNVFYKFITKDEYMNLPFDDVTCEYSISKKGMDDDNFNIVNGIFYYNDKEISASEAEKLGLLNCYYFKVFLSLNDEPPEDYFRTGIKRLCDDCYCYTKTGTEIKNITSNGECFEFTMNDVVNRTLNYKNLNQDYNGRSK